MTRAAFGQKANAALRTALGDLNVSLKFDINGYAPEANDIIVEAMGWRTLQVPRASALTETLTVPKLLDCIGRKDTSGIQALMTDEGVAIFAKADAAALIERLSPNSPWKKSVR